MTAPKAHLYTHEWRRLCSSGRAREFVIGVVEVCFTTTTTTTTSYFAYCTPVCPVRPSDAYVLSALLRGRSPRSCRGFPAFS